MNELLKHWIQTLRLRPDAPFPSELIHAHATVKESLDGLTLVRCGCPVCSRSASVGANDEHFRGVVA